jgi:hypothetical protein
LSACEKNPKGHEGRGTRCGFVMKTRAGLNAERRLEQGKIGYILLWLLGVPIPILLLFFLLRGCT